MSNLRGLAFANHIVASLLGRTLAERGYALTVKSEEVEKDFGVGAVAYFDCGFVTITKDGVRQGGVSQSRFSDSWALESIHAPAGSFGRAPSTAMLVEITKADDPAFVALVLTEAGL